MVAAGGQAPNCLLRHFLMERAGIEPATSGLAKRAEGNDALPRTTTDGPPRRMATGLEPIEP